MLCAYAVLAAVSGCYPPVWGRLPTRYSPVRHSVTKRSFRRNQVKCFVRLACVKHAASVHPEPGSNSHVKIWFCPDYIWLILVAPRFTVLRFFYFNRSVRLSTKHFGLTAWNLFWIFKLIKAFISQKKISDFLLMIQIFWIYWIFQGLFTVQLSMCCKVFQPLSQICSSDSLFTISLCFIFVNNFFKYFSKWFAHHMRLAISLIIISYLSVFVNSFFQLF